jgi:hypothetical protein
MLDSPVKRDSGKKLDENIVYIFTKLPNSVDELNKFLGNTSGQTRIQHNMIYDEVKMVLRPFINLTFRQRA